MPTRHHFHPKFLVSRRKGGGNRPPAVVSERVPQTAKLILPEKPHSGGAHVFGTTIIGAQPQAGGRRKGSELGVEDMGECELGCKGRRS